MILKDLPLSWLESCIHHGLIMFNIAIYILYYIELDIYIYVYTLYIILYIIFSYSIYIAIYIYS